MNRKLRHQLETTKRICEALLAGEKFRVKNSEINLVPAYLDVKSQTKAKQQGLVMKRGAEPVGYWDFQLSTGSGRGNGLLYLGSSFKPKASKGCER